MEQTIKIISIEQLAEKLNGNLWTKGNIKRIYLECGYNTKKMSTKTYIFQRQNKTFGISCIIDCPSQAENWIESQQNQIITSLEERIAEITEEFGEEIENPEIAIQAALDAEEQVQGYYMRWHDVMVKINYYGKLAYRKRQKVHTYKGAASRVPAGFIALNDADFAIAIQKEEEKALYEFGHEPNLVGEAQRAANQKTFEEENQRKEAEAQAAAKLQEDENKKKAAEDLAAKIEELKAAGVTDVVLAWKQLGCPHPAPAEVVEAKNESGLNWKKFTERI